MAEAHGGKVPMAEAHGGKVPMAGAHGGKVPMAGAHGGKISLWQISPWQIFFLYKCVRSRKWRQRGGNARIKFFYTKQTFANNDI